jgi:hypothetical protein
MIASEFASFVLAMLVALILFFGGMRALVELTGNEDLALPVQVVVDEDETAPQSPSIPTPPITPPPESEVPEP